MKNLKIVLMFVVWACWLHSAFAAQGANEVSIDAIDRPDILHKLKLSPKDVRDGRTANTVMKIAETENLMPAGKSNLNSYELSLSDEDTLVVVNARYPQPSSLVFVDAAGNPWPIEKGISLEKQFLNLHKVSESRSNTIVMQTKLQKYESFAQVFLHGLDLPITVKVKSDPTNDSFDAITTIKILKISPFTETNVQNLQVSESIHQSVDEHFLAAKNGVRPDGYRSLPTSSKSVRAWGNGKELLILTDLIVMNPYPTMSAVGINGWRVHRMKYIPVIYFNDTNGQEIKVFLEL